MKSHFPRNKLSAFHRIANRFQSFSPQTLSRLTRTGMSLLFLGVFIRIGASFQTGGLLPPAIQSFDEQVLKFIGSSVRSPQLDFLILDLSSLGSLAVIIAICLIGAVLLLLVRDPVSATHLILVAIGGFKISIWTKAWFGRPRPEIIPKLVQVGGGSFPSGHAVSASAIYITLALLAARHFRSIRARATLFLLAVILIGLVDFSRLYLGVHYPSDVLSGSLLGASWALIMGALFSRPSHFGKEP